MLKRNEIKFPIFLKILPLINDKYWTFIFEDLAYGKCPYGVYLEFKGNGRYFIYCRIKGKDFSYEYNDEDDLNTIYENIHTLFMTRLKITSKTDITLKRVMFDQTMKDTQHISWNSIKKKSVRDNIIEHYVIRAKTDYDLTIKQARQLLSGLLLRFHLKLIISTDVDYDASEDRIKHIRGLELSKRKYTFTTNLTDLEDVTMDVDTREKQMLSSYWHKFNTSF